MTDSKEQARQDLFAALDEDREACKRGDHQAIIAALYKANDCLERLAAFIPRNEAIRLYYAYMFSRFKQS